jgi:hypothetical protein
MAEHTTMNPKHDAESAASAQIESIKDEAAPKKSWEFWVVIISLCLLVRE